MTNFNHTHAEDAPMRFAEHGNRYLGLVGITIGAVTGSSAALADGVHNLADSWAHKAHQNTAEAERHNQNQANIAKARKRAALLIGAGALVVGGYSVNELVNSEPDTSLNLPAAAVELVSIGLNATVALKFRKQHNTLQGQAHSHRHNSIDLISSSVAFAGIAANPFIQHADSAAGLLVSAVTGALGWQIYQDSASKPE